MNNQHTSNILKIIDKLVGKWWADEIYENFIFMTLNAFANCDFNEELHNRMNKYDRKEKDLFNEMFFELVKSYDFGIGLKGWYDPLGFIYEELSGKYKRGKLGQFFTPEHVVDLMVEMTLDNNIKETVNDPTCGSGRFLIATQAKTQGAYVIGEDLDPICVRMAAVNMFMHGCVGEVVCHNTLMPEEYIFGYKINKNLYPGGIMKIDKMEREESFVMRMWQERKEMIKKSEKEATKSLQFIENVEIQNEKETEQLILF